MCSYIPDDPDILFVAGKLEGSRQSVGCRARRHHVPRHHRVRGRGQLENYLWCHTGEIWFGWAVDQLFCKMSQKLNVFNHLSCSSGVIGFWTGCHGHRKLHWACQWRQVLFRFLIFEIHANFIYAASSGIFSAPFSQFKLIVVLVSFRNFYFYFLLHATQQCDMYSYAGNLNPAVSVGLLAGGQLPLVNAILYIVAQVMGRKEILMNDAFWQRVELLCSVSTSVCIIGADMAEPWPHLLIHLLTWYHPCHIILSSKFSLSVHWCCPWCWNPPWLHPDTGLKHAWGKRTWSHQCLWWWSRFCHPWSRSPLRLNFKSSNEFHHQVLFLRHCWPCSWSSLFMQLLLIIRSQ